MIAVASIPVNAAPLPEKLVAVITPVGSNIKLGNAGVITATSFVGSGADLTGVTQSDTPLASSSASTIFYESDDEITVSDNTTLSRSSSNSGVIYTKYQQVVVANTKSPSTASMLPLNVVAVTTPAFPN